MATLLRYHPNMTSDQFIQANDSMDMTLAVGEYIVKLIKEGKVPITEILSRPDPEFIDKITAMILKDHINGIIKGELIADPNDRRPDRTYKDKEITDLITTMYNSKRTKDLEENITDVLLSHRQKTHGGTEIHFFSRSGDRTL